MDLNNYVRKLTFTQHFSMLDSNPKPMDTPSGSTWNIDLPISIDACLEPSGASTVDSLPPISSNLRPISKFYPLHHRGSHIDTLYALVSTELRQIKSIKPRTKYNLTYKERSALKDFNEKRHHYN